MSVFILVLLTFTFGLVECTDNNSTIFAKLPEVMSYLCPGVDVCGKVYEIPNLTNSKGLCCTACSCESNCEINENCCFPSKLSYTTDNIDLNWLPSYKRECLYPTTLELQKYQKMLYQPYYMITSVPNNVSCGDTKIAVWGSFYPMYSASRKQIYKNIHCAIADGVTDSQPWNVILSCDFLHKFPRYNPDLFHEIDPLAYVNQLFEQWTYFNDWNCHVNFLTKSRNIESLKCYTNVIDVCLPPGSFQVPRGIDFSATEIIDACSSGLVSPYWRNEIYKNVFCFICNNETYRQDNVCYPPSTSLRGMNDKWSIFRLIDTNAVLEEDFKEKPSTKASIPLVCVDSKQNKEDCRQLHCPLGQMPDQFENCQYSIGRMYDQLFIVIVNVTADIHLNVTDLINRNTIKTFTSPWPESWKIISVRQFEERTNMNYTHLRIELLGERLHAGMRTAGIMKIIKTYVKRDWILKDGKRSYLFQSELPTWDHVGSPGNETFIDSIRIVNHTLYLTLPRSSFAFYDYLLGLEHSLLLKSIRQIISRLHFCKLVELRSSEFVLSKSKLALFNVRTQRIMYIKHSFVISERTYVRDTRVRICVEDSGLFLDSKSPSLSKHVTLHMILVQWLFL